MTSYENQTVNSKTCSKCGEEKDFSEFAKKVRGKYGLRADCKECRRKYVRAYIKTDGFKEKNKRYRKSEATKQTLIRYKNSDKGKKNNANFRASAGGAFSVIFASGHRRNVEVSVTRDEFISWWETEPDECCYCGLTLEQYITIRDLLLHVEGDNFNVVRYKHALSLTTNQRVERMTVERVSNEIGYATGNLAKCCLFCNQFKSNVLSADTMKIIGPIMLKKLLAYIGSQALLDYGKAKFTA